MFILMIRIEPSALCMLSTSSTTELYPHPLICFFICHALDPWTLEGQPSSPGGDYFSHGHEPSLALLTSF